MNIDYVHGYNQREAERLNDQASSLSELLHHDSIWPIGSHVLEAGCGVGAQTQFVARNNPDVNFTCVDISNSSLDEARSKCDELRISNVDFLCADLYKLPYPDAHFDHIFVCFVLEHVSDVKRMLKELQRVLKSSGTITVIEGDHGSAYFNPPNIDANRAIQCLVDLQSAKGGDACIGRKLYPILTEFGFTSVVVSPRMVYVDDSHPELVKGFTLNTFTAMISGIADEAVDKELISPEKMNNGLQALRNTANGGGTFCYTFFKAQAVKY